MPMAGTIASIHQAFCSRATAERYHIRSMSSRGLAAGTVISGKYKLTERLGGGGMGDVYRAEHQLAGRMVALKLLRSELAGNPDVTRRFFQEAQAVNKIRHPNIVDVIDADFSPMGPYVVMECLDGVSLAYALGRVGKLNLDTALAVILPMLDALDAAHRHGIVHRDLKPENVFVAGGGPKGEVRVKLLDFGIAKVMSEAAGPQTGTGIIFGTPDYLSPEQALGEQMIDGRSDLFSVGTVLFELLTGKRPWESSNAVATAYRIVHSPPPTLEAMGVTNVDPLIQKVLDIALAKDKTERFGTAAAFADALAPVAPDGATRREMLRALLETTVVIAPTQAAPKHDDSAPSFSFQPSLPSFLQESMPASDGWAPPKEVPPAAVTPKPALDPIAPTMQSADYILPKAPAARSRMGSQPEIRERPSDKALPTATPSSGVTRPSSPTISSSRPTLSTPTRTTTSPRPMVSSRPLPPAVKGRCHVRGTLPRSAALWIERTHGKVQKDAVLGALPVGLAESYRSDAFNALVWYDIEALHAFLEAATHIVLLDDSTAWRNLARDNFERDLAPIFRPSASRDTMSFLKRLPAGLARLLDFGTARVDEQATNKVRVKIAGFEAASAAMRFLVAGILDGMLAGTPGLVVRPITGDQSFAPEFELDVLWRELSR
jgi:serine/threonine-protein kinase